MKGWSRLRLSDCLAVLVPPGASLGLKLAELCPDGGQAAHPVAVDPLSEQLGHQQSISGGECCLQPLQLGLAAGLGRRVSRGS